ncbi:MAG: PLP-dependent lyase/thiolase [Nanoarchaeota archaeon]|nr:PLP-dependent lyase/thiolase [Nanoarchaeota archaeon]
MTIEFSEVMNWDLVEQWADSIPVYPENDPNNPEWKATPTFLLDLSGEGYGLVHVKDESVNPTGVAKDRPAWECASIYRDMAKSLWLRKSSIDGKISRIPVPKFSLITAGNEGRAISHIFKKYDLPPINLIIDINEPEETVNALEKLYANIVKTDLSQKELNQKDILEMTNNLGGLNLNKALHIRAQEIFYDWLVHEAFNQKPDEIYVPYGSGRLMENFLTWQEKNIRKYISDKKADPRLNLPLEHLLQISILGAEPERIDSQADKLPAYFKPFILFDDQDVSSLINLKFTGENTGVSKVKESYIIEAFKIFQKHRITAEPSAATGLALYMQRYDQSKINPKNKILIINTGKGI